MQFRIADSFTASLAKLTGEEQKAVKTTAFDLQLNPVSPGFSFHKLDRARDKNFWSVRVNRDIRIIVHRTDTSLLLCYVDHHDKAYDWAERRKLEVHPKTGAAQLVEIRESVQEVLVPSYVYPDISRPKPLLFEHVAEETLLGYGVPPEWLADVKRADEDGLLALADYLPGEAAEALLELATGGSPQVQQMLPPGSDPFSHPDAQRRFRVMTDVEELERALDYPWEKWTVFLHPAQRQWVEQDYSGPARVSGSAGTGKTIVALHRAVFLAQKNPDARVLLATFSDTLANALQTKLRRLISNRPLLAERLEVHSMNALGERLYGLHFEPLQLASDSIIKRLLAEASTRVQGHKFSLQFLYCEWRDVVDMWQLKAWEEYRDVRRLGRKTRLPESQRELIWSIFDQMHAELRERCLITRAHMFARLATKLPELRRSPFEFTVIDEAQDISIPQLQFLAALGADRPNGLFFTGDLGQRIFQQPFSWKALGVDIRGRSRTLRINYRTSHQIRRRADCLLEPEISDVDGNLVERRGTVSVFNGPNPKVLSMDTVNGEIQAVSQWLVERSQEGVLPREIGIFVRSDLEMGRARQAVADAGLAFKVLDESVELSAGHVSICTMHLAKGLEFRSVVVMACDDEVIPSQTRIESVVDSADLEEVYCTERHLLYVACTRARDHLLITSGNVRSEFLDDFNR